ncbi:hypothetical protein AIOL_000299 [Candidatus Rhodobacter oscarellae]|uniref:Hedgehog/Intein (Hint) domain-containing protein n=1 Tax=Candidatus Rhodobacter oscarellae TaxID=1675527 RepID=A0A0J9EC01_9RHOB|nr:Hint domain-containing protein [Candidatus Rhodobacter lobularis]KMW60146.1 hypothetical protein AIOL_000299 [Candidatus Rhodobacter lobularis]
MGVFPGGIEFFVADNEPTTDATDTDPGGGNAQGDSRDNYVYDFDLTSLAVLDLTGSVFTRSGEAISNVSTNYESVATVGTFTLDLPLPDSTLANYTYQVTRDELIANGVSSITFTVTGDWTQAGGDPAFGTDTDTVTFNFTLCFAAGTGIATPSGKTAVESLLIGDLVTTADGRDVPVKWVGRVTANPMFNPADRLAPVKIAKGAFGDAPTRDLIVTADHGMVLDGMIINASALVNGDTITWHDWKALGASITYYHVETENHDVILADGALSETYLDMPDRSSFDNFAEYIALYGEETPIAENPMPRISSARLLPASLRAARAA